MVIAALGATITVGGAPPSAAGQELLARQLEFYGHIMSKGPVVLYVDGKKIEAGPGDRVGFNVYDSHYGTAFALIDIAVDIVNNNSSSATEVEVRLSITPKVAPIITFPELGRGPSAANRAETERRGVWFAPLLVLRKAVGTIRAKGERTVIFENVDIRTIIDGYASRDLWPTMLRFEVTVEPKGGGRNIAQSTTRRELRIMTPEY